MQHRRGWTWGDVAVDACMFWIKLIAWFVMTCFACAAAYQTFEVPVQEDPLAWSLWVDKPDQTAAQWATGITFFICLVIYFIPGHLRYRAAVKRGEPPVEFQKSVVVLKVPGARHASPYPLGLRGQKMLDNDQQNTLYFS